ncbi:MAG: hypothetical protein Q7S61_05010 [bacterium]|nr:hypothetical protein [bacterium]
MKHLDHMAHLFKPKTIIIVSLALASLAIFWQLANRSLSPSKAASLGEATVTLIGEDNKDLQMYVVSAVVKAPLTIIPSGMMRPMTWDKISGIDVTFDMTGDIQMGPPTLAKVEEYGSSPANEALEEVVKDVTNAGKRVHFVYVDRKSTSELPPAVIIKFPLIRTSPVGGTIRIINNQSDIAFDVTGMDPTTSTNDLPLTYDVDRLDPKKYSYLVPMVLPSPAPQYTGIPAEPTVVVNPRSTVTPTGSTTCASNAQGDANCDGKIDMIDFEIFRKEMAGELKTFKGDFNKNKRIDIVDFEIWRANFFKPKGNVNSSVEVP